MSATTQGTGLVTLSLQKPEVGKRRRESNPAAHASAPDVLSCVLRAIVIAGSTEQEGTWVTPQPGPLCQRSCRVI